MYFLLTAALLFAIQTVGSSPAGEQVSSPPRTTRVIVPDINGWSIFEARRGCSAVTTYQTDRTVVLLYDFGLNRAWLSVSDPAWRSVRDSASYDVGVRFSNGDTYSGGHALGLGPDATNGSGVFMRFGGRDFLVSFASADSISLTLGTISLGVFSLRGTRAVVERLISCARDFELRNPTDPFSTEPAARPRYEIPSFSDTREGQREARRSREGSAIAELRAIHPPRPINRPFTLADYPVAARSNHEAGRASYRVSVGTDGRVTDCIVTVSSGSQSLDDVTCAVMRERGLFRSAMDSEGRSMPGSYDGSVTWSEPTP